MPKKLIILGEFNPAWETHALTNAAVEHSLDQLGLSLDIEWCSTEKVTLSGLKACSGILVATGTPYKNTEKAIEVIRYAREHKVPCLGTCQGFQHIMLEYAQNFLGIATPGHAEHDPSFDKPFISELSCSLRGQTMSLNIIQGSLLHKIHGATQATEKYYCSFGINPEYTDKIDRGGITVSGIDSEGAIRVVEYSNHPFMLATLFVPQAGSVSGNPHPLVTALVEKTLGQR